MPENNHIENGEQKKISEVRRKWLAGLSAPNKIELAFELEMMLKALDRFFNVENLPMAEPDRAIAVNFKEEVEIVLQYLTRIINISRSLMEASQGKMFQFRTYVETSLLNDLGRTKIREASFEQKSPDDSLFLLFTGLMNIRGVVRIISKQPRIPYPIYVNIGNLISREIIANRFFNPVREIEFRPEFDKIENRKISRLVLRISHDQLKRQFSIIILVLFRLLRYLDHIHPKINSIKELKFNIPIFALINSECRQLIEYLEKHLPATLKVDAEELTSEERDLISAFLKCADSLGFQLAMELKKINRSELMGATKTKELPQLRSGIENSHGVLTNFFQQSIIQVTKIFDPHIEGKDIFPFYTSRLRQSLQLRNDIWVFKELMERFEEKAETNTEGDTDIIYLRYLSILKDYIRYFRMDSYALLRYDDLKEFDKFFLYIDSTEPSMLKNRDNMNEFIYKTKFFKIFIEATLSNIENRSELKNRPIDIRACERFLKEFIIASMKKATGGKLTLDFEKPEPQPAEE